MRNNDFTTLRQIATEIKTLRERLSSAYLRLDQELILQFSENPNTITRTQIASAAGMSYPNAYGRIGRYRKKLTRGGE